MLHRLALPLALLLALAACADDGAVTADPGPADVAAADPGPGDPGAPDLPTADPGADAPVADAPSDLPAADAGPDVPADVPAADVPTDLPADLPADAGPTPPADGTLGGPCGIDGFCTEGSCREVPQEPRLVCTRECLDNPGCPDALRCEAVSDVEMACLFGPRGTGAVGDPCGPGMGLGCASGLCVEADPANDVPVDTCTASCGDDGDCRDPFPTCYVGVYLCLPAH